MGCYHPQGVLKSISGGAVEVTYVAVKGKRNTFGQRC